MVALLVRAHGTLLFRAPGTLLARAHSTLLVRAHGTLLVWAHLVPQAEMLATHLPDYVSDIPPNAEPVVTVVGRCKDGTIECPALCVHTAHRIRQGRRGGGVPSSVCEACRRLGNVCPMQYRWCVESLG